MYSKKQNEQIVLDVVLGNPESGHSASNVYSKHTTIWADSVQIVAPVKVA